MIVTINRSPSWGDMSVGTVVNLPDALALPLVATGEAVPTPNATPTQSSPFSNTSGGVVALTVAEFATLEAADGLTAGVEYYLTNGPARWIATGPDTKDAVVFVQDGVTYIGDEAQAAQTEIDLAAGTWATRPLSGFTAGVVYYRRMTDVGTQPGGCTMSWLGGTSTEWHVTQPTWVALDPTHVAGAAQTALQVINPKDLLAGILKAGTMFEVYGSPSRSNTTDTMTPTMYLGAAGTTADTALRAYGTVSGTETHKAMAHMYKVVDDSTIALLGTASGGGSWIGTSSTASPMPTYAVPVTSALKISLGTTMAGTTSTPGVEFIGVRLIP